MTGDEPLIVVDCSVIVDALVMAELGDLRRDLSGLTLFAPALLDYVVLSALRGLTLGGRLSSHRATEALGDYLDLPIVKVSLGAEQARAAWEMRANLTAYDAAYAVLAGALDVPLWTRDAKLADAVGPGFRCHVV